MFLEYLIKHVFYNIMWLYTKYQIFLNTYYWKDEVVYIDHGSVMEINKIKDGDRHVIKVLEECQNIDIHLDYKNELKEKILYASITCDETELIEITNELLNFSYYISDIDFTNDNSIYSNKYLKDILNHILEMNVRKTSNDTGFHVDLYIQSSDGPVFNRIPISDIN